MGIFGSGSGGEKPPPAKPKADFSNVKATSSSTAQAPTAPATEERSYVVVKGDTLSKIAQKFYGKASAWPRIFEANKDLIKDPDLIHPGQKLRIPQ